MTGFTPKKEVSFFERVSCKRTLHINDYNEEERQACWYQADEFEAMKQEARQTVKFMEQNADCLDDVNFCRRGLEFRTNEESQKRYTLKGKAVDVVMDEMERQWAFCECNPEIIAELYQSITRQCQIEAHLRALADFDAAYPKEITPTHTLRHVLINMQSPCKPQISTSRRQRSLSMDLTVFHPRRPLAA